MTEQRCDVCGRDGWVAVGASPLAAMSLAYCTECLQQGAEPEWLVAATVECCGGAQHVHPEVLETPVFRSGRYEPWNANAETDDA